MDTLREDIFQNNTNPDNPVVAQTLSELNGLFQTYGSNMEPFHEDFLTSIKKRLEQNIPLTEKQDNLYRKIKRELQEHDYFRSNQYFDI